MSVLVSGSFANSLLCAGASDKPDASKAPAEIIFIPEGSNRIFPLSHKEGVAVNLPPEQGESIAAALNDKLKARLDEDVAPWFDIEHTRKFPASGYPTAFRYEKGKGIMAAVDWSATGRKAIEGRDVRYFSPEFYIDDNGIPSGIPERGPLGGLVTEPAFRKIGAIAASDARDNQPTTTPIMSKLIFAALSISASADTAEADALKAIEKLKADHGTMTAADSDKAEQIAELKKKIAELEAEGADKMVKAAVADGRILPKDTDTQDKFREKIAAGDSFAVEILGKLPKINADLDKSIVRASDGTAGSTEQRVAAAQAKARAELGENAGFSLVWARAAEIDPSAFEA